MTVINILEEGRYGGAQRRVVEVAALLQKKDIKTIVIIPYLDSERLRSELDKSNVDFICLKIHRLTLDPIGLIKYVVFFMFEIIKLVNLIRKYKECVVHGNGSYQVKAMIASKLAGAKNVWHLNDSYAPAPVRTGFKIVGRLFADSFIVAAKRTREYYLSNMPWKKHTTLLNEPVRCDYFTATPRDIFNFDHPLTILTVGNVSPVKGYDTLIKLAKELKKLTDIKFQFVIVGELLDSQKSYIENLYREMKSSSISNVEFVGAQLDIKKYLQLADLYLCTSNFESSPMSVWEAMSMSLPIISTDVGDVKEIFTINNCGLVSNTGDHIQLAKHVTTYLKNPELAREHARNAREVALRDFDISICADGHYEHYSALVHQ